MKIGSCETCVYRNKENNCWARKGKAIYGKIGCDYREKETARLPTISLMSTK